MKNIKPKKFDFQKFEDYSIYIMKAKSTNSDQKSWLKIRQKN